jgi:hypothetical protein
MQKRSWFYLGGLFVFSALASFFRWLQNLNAFDAETGLFTGVGFVTIALLALCAGMLVFLFLFNAALPKDCLGETPRALFRHTAPLVMAAVLLSALLIFLGGLLLFFDTSSASSPLLARILALCAIVSGAVIPLLLIESGRGFGSTAACFYSTIPLIFTLFWLIFTYKEQSTNPIIWSFAFEVLAIAAAILSFYYLAGYFFGSPKPNRVLFSSGLAAFLSFICIADDLSLGVQAIFLGFSLLNGALGWSLIRNATEVGKHEYL